MRPARALAYRPLRSRASHTSSGVATWISTKSPTSVTIERTAARAAAYGAIGAQMAIPPCRATSVATDPEGGVVGARVGRRDLRPARQRAAHGAPVEQRHGAVARS